jgi:hypothetical protein
MSTSFRAGVMLSVLVGLPAAWVYYGPLPPGAQRVVDRFMAAAKEATGWDKSPANRAAAPAEDAPEFVIGGEQTAAALASSSSPSAGGSAAPVFNPTPTSSNRNAANEWAGRQALEPLLEQLRRLGAATYVLEPWGTGQNLFRFRCEMPIAEGDAMLQQFEAIAADPAVSVQQVVTEVSTWQVARAGSTVLR